MRIKEGKFSVYEIDPMYLEYLSKYDKNVRKKSNRKYYGILITKEKTDYCIPFTSKVKKRNPKLTINIKNKKEVIAQLTINNMIPVIGDVVHKVNIKNDKSKYYLYRELYFLRKYDVIQEILNKAEKVLNVLNDKNNIDFDFFKVVCCNFKLLEMNGKISIIKICSNSNKYFIKTIAFFFYKKYNIPRKTIFYTTKEILFI